MCPNDPRFLREAKDDSPQAPKIFRLSGTKHPALEGPFWLPLRLYGQGKAILDKTWKVPPVKKVI
jgi:hypothetical protein